MRNTEINFKIELDDNRVPEKIVWDATENPNEGVNDTKAISISVWDHYQKGLLGINLWTKDMPVDEMNHFAVDIIGNLAQMIADSTNNQTMLEILNNAARDIHKLLEAEAKAATNN